MNAPLGKKRGFAGKKVKLGESDTLHTSQFQFIARRGDKHPNKAVQAMPCDVSRFAFPIPRFFDGLPHSIFMRSHARDVLFLCLSIVAPPLVFETSPRTSDALEVSLVIVKLATVHFWDHWVLASLLERFAVYLDHSSTVLLRDMVVIALQAASEFITPDFITKKIVSLSLIHI